MKHLAQAALDALALSDEDRIEYVLGERWIEYPAATKALDALGALLHQPKVYRMPNRLIVSETNNGKTSLIRRFLSLHHRAEDPSTDQFLAPILLVQAPPQPDERRFLASVLDCIGMPHVATQKTELLFRQVQTLLPKLGVRMLIIDEIHHLIAGSNARQRVFMNVLKYLSNELMIPLVAAGTSEAFNAVRVDPQIANRFSPIELPKWGNNSDFRRLLRSFEALLPLQRASDLSNPQMSLRLYGMCEGTIGEVSSLLNAAAVEAIGREEAITDHVLDRIPWVPPSVRKGRRDG
jgi:hypothetical protein